MMRTPTKPPDDKTMWRKVKARTHPDTGGSHELFIWVGSVEELVCSGKIEATSTAPPSAQRPGPSPKPDAVPFDPAIDFQAISFCALWTAKDVPELYGQLLLLLKDCEEVYSDPLANQQRRGASYRQLAAIGHAVGMSKSERITWYRIAESIPLSARHAGHILSKLMRGPA